MAKVHHRHKGKATIWEIDYKMWVRTTFYYLEVKITEGIRLTAKTMLPAYRWHYHIAGKDNTLFNNTDLNWTPKAKNNIQICTEPLYAMSQLIYCYFYHTLSILEDINNIVHFGPLLIDHLLAHYYAKSSGQGRCCISKPTKNIYASFQTNELCRFSGIRGRRPSYLWERTTHMFRT